MQIVRKNILSESLLITCFGTIFVKRERKSTSCNFLLKNKKRSARSREHLIKQIIKQSFTAACRNSSTVVAIPLQCAGTVPPPVDGVVQRAGTFLPSVDVSLQVAGTNLPLVDGVMRNAGAFLPLVDDSLRLAGQSACVAGSHFAFSKPLLIFKSYEKVC
jgi:hypothetical protein